MANLVIKKNFVDGDKLFAQQLNNNFETIEKAINDGNKIVWQDGTEVKFKRYVTNDIDSLPVLDGSIIYDTAKGRQYIDYKGQRIQVGSAGREVIIQEAQPTEEDNKIWIDSDVINTMGTEIMNEHSDSKIMGYSANYLNERLVKVSPTEPTTGEEVWVQKSNNLFDKNKCSIVQDSVALDISELVIGKTYTFSTNISVKSFKISNYANGYNSVNKDDENGFTTFTFTMARNSNMPEGIKQYLFLAISAPYQWISDIAQLNGYNIQIEEGNTATSYEEYVDKKIYTKNNNGVYEEFCKETVETDWFNIEFQNTYSKLEGNYDEFQYKKINNQVFLRGMITNTVVPSSVEQAVVGTLPTGVRPQKVVYVLGDQVHTPVECSIDSNGDIRVFNTTANKWVSLAGISFFID